MASVQKQVSDVMRSDLVTTSRDTPLREFVEIAEREQISGAPVVDDADRPVGVISLTDVVRVLRWDAAGEPVPAGDEGSEGTGDRAASPGAGGGNGAEGRRRLGERPGALAGETGGARTVGDVMTSSVFSVRPDASLTEAARFLADAQIHRALVLHEGRLLGLVTTFDLLDALAAGAEG